MQMYYSYCKSARKVLLMAMPDQQIQQYEQQCQN